MADVRSCFPILADDTSGAGECAISRIEGEAAAAKEGLIGFAFKDSSGNVVLPQLNADGTLPVDTEGSDFTCLHAEGEDAAPVVDTESDLATITLTDATTYKDIYALVSNSRWTLYRIYWVDDVGGAGTETDLGYIQVGPGQFSFETTMTCVQFTSGTTAELRIAGTSKHTASTLRATLAVKELA